MQVAGYSISPHVHAFDNASLVKTLPAQAATVASARAIAGDLPLAIGPITLKPRFNSAATGPEPERGPDELPSQVDPRQTSPLRCRMDHRQPAIARDGRGRLTDVF